MNFVGIDCGFTGGIAALIKGAPMPLLFEMPTVSFAVKRVRNRVSKLGTKTELNDAAVLAILREVASYGKLFVMLEKAQVRPDQGTVSSAEFMGQYYAMRMACVALGLAYEPVHPATWKSDIFRGQTRGDGDAKEASRAKAIQLYPMLASRLSLKKTHGLAEALLIARYGQMRFNSPI